MQYPIVASEFGFGLSRFKLDVRQWDAWRKRIEEIGVGISVKSRQSLEDCERNVTSLIAEEGSLCLLSSEFKFSAQLDCDGFALYVGGLEARTEAADRLRAYLRANYEEST